jgi:hypothetical protein
VRIADSWSSLAGERLRSPEAIRRCFLNREIYRWLEASDGYTVVVNYGSRSAIAAPIPREAPVTIATLFVASVVMSSFPLGTKPTISPRLGAYRSRRSGRRSGRGEVGLTRCLTVKASPSKPKTARGAIRRSRSSETGRRLCRSRGSPEIAAVDHRAPSTGRTTLSRSRRSSSGQLDGATSGTITNLLAPAAMNASMRSRSAASSPNTSSVSRS